ncbi:neprilysin-4-like [Argopecten irradians]|uniref:neprilysin-4-like n=1 Tax=Argopecten irradians TaxID=31199 RepID=UPI00371638B5
MDTYPQVVTLEYGSIETLGLDVIRPLAEDIGGWPILDPNWSSRHYQLETMLAAARKYNVDTPIISLSVESDPSLPEKHIIHIEQPHLGLPDRNLFLTENKAYAAYVTYMLEVFKAFGANQSTVSNDVKDMVVFETQLAKLTQNVEEHHDHSQDQRLTIDQLQHMFPGLDWKQYIYNIFNMDQVRITIHSNDVVLLSNAEYFRNVFSLLQNTSARAEANYINWMLLQDLIMTLPAKIRQLHQTFTQALPDATPESPRWQQCVDETNKAFSLAVARLFVDQHFDTASKLEVSFIVIGKRGRKYGKPFK